MRHLCSFCGRDFPIWEVREIPKNGELVYICKGCFEALLRKLYWASKKLQSENQSPWNFPVSKN